MFIFILYILGCINANKKKTGEFSKRYFKISITNIFKYDLLKLGKTVKEIFQDPSRTALPRSLNAAS